MSRIQIEDSFFLVKDCLDLPVMSNIEIKLVFVYFIINTLLFLKCSVENLVPVTIGHMLILGEGGARVTYAMFGTMMS